MMSHMRLFHAEGWARDRRRTKLRQARSPTVRERTQEQPGVSGGGKQCLDNANSSDRTLRLALDYR